MKTSTKMYLGSGGCISVGCAFLADAWWKGLIATVAFIAANSFEAVGNWSFFHKEKGS